MTKLKKLTIGLLLFTTGAIAIYWLTVFTDISEVVEKIPGYTDWFMSFPLADGWIAICALLAALYLIKGKPQMTLFGLLTGSSLLFLGLSALMYGIHTGLLFDLTWDEVTEIIIKLYCLTVGSFLIHRFWSSRKELEKPV